MYFKTREEDDDAVKLVILDTPSYAEYPEGVTFKDYEFYTFFNAFFKSYIPSPSSIQTIKHTKPTQSQKIEQIGYLYENSYRYMKGEILKFNKKYNYQLNVIDDGYNTKYKMIEGMSDYEQSTYFLINAYGIKDVDAPAAAPGVNLELDFIYKVYNPEWKAKLSPFNSPTLSMLTTPSTPTNSTSVSSVTSTFQLPQPSNPSPSLSSPPSSTSQSYTFAEALPLLSKMFYNLQFYPLPKILLKNKALRKLQL